MSMASCYFPSSQEDDSWPVRCQDLHTRLRLWILFASSSLSFLCTSYNTTWLTPISHQSCRCTQTLKCSEFLKHSTLFMLPPFFHGHHPSWPLSCVWHRQAKLTLWQHCRLSHNLTVYGLSLPADYIHQVLLLRSVSAQSVAVWNSCFKPKHYWYN